MSVTEVTTQSWFSRIKSAFGGILFGIILFIAAFPVLFKNEGRAVKTAKSLKEGAAAVLPVSSDRVDAGNEGKLVHFMGEAIPQGELADSDFGVTQAAIQLARTVEMYQWQETSESSTKKKVGGGTETTTTYNYHKDWSEGVVDSSSFKESQGHENPAAMPFSSRDWWAEEVTVGAFSLNDGLIHSISRDEALQVTSEELAASRYPQELQISNGVFYRGEDPQRPQIGDVRVSFSVVKPTTVSVIAQQRGDSLTPYQTKAGRALSMLEIGQVGADQMFEQAQASNRTLTWILRLVGIFIMFLGLKMIFAPLAVLADVIPPLGGLVSMGTGLVAAMIAIPLSLITIALGWMVYRPLLGITVLVVAVAAFVFLLRMALAKKRKAPAPELPPLPQTPQG